jgi:hypothetical protein
VPALANPVDPAFGEGGPYNDFRVLAEDASAASASSASLTGLTKARLWWASKVDRDVVAAGADGADAADSTDDGGSVLHPRDYPDRPGARSPLAREGYFNAQHTKERLRTTQPASEGGGILRPIGDLGTGKASGGTKKV